MKCLIKASESFQVNGLTIVITPVRGTPYGVIITKDSSGSVIKAQRYMNESEKQAILKAMT